MSYTPNIFKINASGDAELAVANLIANSIKSGSSALTYTASGDDVTGNFGNPGTGIEYAGVSWGNIWEEEVGNKALGITTVTFPESSIVNPSNATDGAPLTSATSSGQAGSGNFHVRIDMGSSVVVRRIEVRFEAKNATTRYPSTGGTIRLEGSNTDMTSGFSVLDSITNPHVITFGVHDWSLDFPGNTSGARYIGFNADASGTGEILLYEIRIFTSKLATTNNTVDADIPATGTLSYVPASLMVKNPSDIDLGTGQVNVAYSFDNVSFTSPVDLNTFKALNKSLFASKPALWIRVQPVEESRIKSVAIQTEGAEARADEGGFTFYVDAVPTAKIGTDALVTKNQIYSESVSLTSSGNAVSVDASLSNTFTHALTENTVISAPSNIKAGVLYNFVLIQDASTAYTCGFNAVFKGAPSAVSATLSSVNAFQFMCYDGTNLVLISEKIGA